MSNETIKAYQSLAKDFSKIEAKLGLALAALDEAREKKDAAGITTARKRALEIERTASALWEEMEGIRRGYWLHAAEEAGERFLDKAISLIAEHETLMKRANQLLPVASSTGILLQRLAAMTRPECAIAADLPTVQLSSSVLDRAEDEI